MTAENGAMIRSPGKLFLFGEYVVLDGAPAVAMAVDRYVRLYAVKEKSPKDPSWDLIKLARLEAARVVDFPLNNERYVADSSELYYHHHKLGLGSSAAVTTSAAASIFYESGLDISSAEHRVSMWRVCQKVHNSFFSYKGSGLDLAASLFGGTISMQLSSEPGQEVFKPWQIPEDLHLVFVWIGYPSTTKVFVEAVRRFKIERFNEYDAIARPMIELSERFIARNNESSTDILELFREYAAKMKELGQHADAPIVTPEMPPLFELAEHWGGAAKPSGAGGGDFIVAAFTKPEQSEGFINEVRNYNFTAFQFGVDQRGVHHSVIE